jgi:hypothetical protein
MLGDGPQAAVETFRRDPLGRAGGSAARTRGSALASAELDANGMDVSGRLGVLPA